MLAEPDRQAIHDSLSSKWPRHKNLDHYTAAAVSLGHRLGVSVEQLLDAIEEHVLDDTERQDGYRVGQWPPDPSNLKSQLEAGAERERRERKAEDVARQKAEREEAQKSAGQTIPNAPAGVVEWTALVSKNAAHMKGLGPALSLKEIERYQELKLYFKPKEPHPNVTAYWANLDQRRAEQRGHLTGVVGAVAVLA